ncbi:MAG TPA: alpha-amylase family protein, partial [Bryobacterales bacterium]|nr:alpha-amylase family protein [Bryobacterales bacterium]
MFRHAISFLLLLVLAALPFIASPVARAAEGIATPAWLENEPLIIVGNWDSMPIFHRRRGGAPVWQEDEYRKELTEETARKLKDLGVTMAVIHFFKGFGLEAEKPHIDDARRLAALLHKYGIRVGLYVGSTIAYETFLLEKPEAQDWFAPDYLGQPVFYDNQTFRKRVYFMHPGYRDYIKRVLRLGVEDLHADEIDFDNTSMQAQPPIFLHPLAVEQFRDYLRSKYSPETLRLRFGFSDVRYVEPPRYDRPLTAINDPLFEEWADFRCHQIDAYYKEMASLIRSLNPNTVIATNPHSGISGRNTVWDQGIDYPTLLPYMDITWTEEGNEAAVTPDGILVSKIRTYKMATSLGKRVLTYTAGGRGGKLQMAESMAYNRQGLGMVGGALAGYDLPDDQRRYIRFFLDHFQDFRGVDNIANVAVLHSHASMAFNNDLPWQSSMLFEQALIQGRVPFDIIFDESLRDLSKYRVLALPDQECLSDEQFSQIRDFVRRGGGLIATEEASLYTPWRQRRRDFGLADLFRVQAPPWEGPRRPDELLHTSPVRSETGRGRVVYVASIRPATAKPATAPMLSKYWKLPLNWRELLEETRWAAGGDFALDVKAPDTVTA